jgi:methylamine dehydrogenase heavy chain
MMVNKSVVAMALVLAGAAPLRAELQPEQLTVVSLPETMRPHWLWVNDIAFFNMPDGRAYLVDADSGKVLGMVSGGYGHGTLLIHPTGKYFAVPSTFYSRGSRGQRTDVATFYKTSDLAPRDEALLPAKRYNGIPFNSTATVMPGGRFSLIYNFTPEQSLTVLDMEAHKAVGEFATPGCGLIFPTAPQRFFMLCSDGSTQPGSLSATGEVVLGKATPQLFPVEDPVTEKGVWTGRDWLFFSRDGKVYVVNDGNGQPRAVKQWSLIQSAGGQWRPGGMQTAAYHRQTDTLYVLMLQGDESKHKDPGTELWVYKASEGKLLRRVPLPAPSTSVAISQDASPLLYTVSLGDTTLRVLDPATGKVIRAIPGMGPTMTIIQPAPVVSTP